MINRYPLIHSCLFRISNFGLRGSHILWRILTTFLPLRSGWYRTPDDVLVNLNTIDYVSRNLYMGLYERELFFLVSILKKRKGVVIDVGAHIGALAHALKVSSSNKDVKLIKYLGFEPIKELFEQLEITIQDLGLDYKLLRTALGSTNKKASIRHAIGSSNSGKSSFLFSFPANTESRIVPLRTLDSYLHLLCDDEILFMKIDVEGFEAHVFEGMQLLLDKNAPKIIYFEFTPFENNTKRVTDAISILRTTHRLFRLSPVKKFRSSFSIVELKFDQIASIKKQTNLILIEDCEVHNLTHSCKHLFGPNFIS